MDSASSPSASAGLAATRRQEAVLAFGRRVGIEPPLAILAEDAGVLLRATLDADFSGVALLEAAQSLSLSMTCAAGPQAGREDSRVSLDPLISLPGYAIKTAAPVVTGDLAGERRFDDLLLRRLGIRAGVCVPLYASGKPLGALGAYCSQCRSFDRGEVAFAESVGHLLAASIARLRAEEELRRQKIVSAALLSLTGGLAFFLTDDGSVVSASDEAAPASGRSASDIPGRAVSDLLAADGASTFKEALQRCRREGVGECIAAIVDRAGQPTPFRWALRRLARGAPPGSSILAVALKIAPSRPSTGAGGLVEAGPRDIQDLVRAVAPATGETSEDERRKNPRVAFGYRQRIAVYQGNGLPPAHDFFEVQCHDISAGGISFFLGSKPQFQEVVVALGRVGAPNYLLARVARVVRREGEGRYLVGCQFVGRVH